MKRINRVQKLARHEEKAVIKRIFWLSVVSIFLIGIIFTIGIPFLGKFADFLDTIFKVNDTENSIENKQIPSPILNELPHNVSDELITLSGFSSNSSRVEVYLNSDKTSEAEVNGGQFEILNFRLMLGENKIRLKAVDENGNSSDFSNEVSVFLDKTEPGLEVTSPTEGQTFNENNRIKIEGKAEKNAQVFANGFLANVDNDGNFDVIIPLVEGENIIEVKAVDEANNSKTIEIKVNFRK